MFGRGGGAGRLPQDPGHESVVLDRACRGSRVEKICGQNQCIGTLMERSNRFGNFSFFPSAGAVAGHYCRRKNNILKSTRDRTEGLSIYAASGTKHDAVDNYSSAACI